MLSPLLVSLATAVVLTQVATFNTTIYLHRCATHRALTLHPTIAWLFRFALWITTGLSTKEWVAVHRKHHAFTDEDGDPHSPRLKGFWPVQLGNVFFYVRETRNAETIEKIRARHQGRSVGSMPPTVAWSAQRPARSRSAPSSASAGDCSPQGYTP